MAFDGSAIQALLDGAVAQGVVHGIAAVVVDRSGPLFHHAAVVAAMADMVHQQPFHHQRKAQCQDTGQHPLLITGKQPKYKQATPQGFDSAHVVIIGATDVVQCVTSERFDFLGEWFDSLHLRRDEVWLKLLWL